MTAEAKEQLKNLIAADAAEKYQSSDPETVTVGKPVAVKEVVEPEPVASPKSKTLTNWNILTETGLFPSYIKCEGYWPMHPFNSGCHSAMQLRPAQLADHIEAHGGGYFVSFKENYANNHDSNTVRVGRPWDGWKQFEELGIELKDLRCDICGEEVKLTVRSIHRHCKPHQGKSTRLKPGGDFWFTLSYDAPLSFGDEE